ncbi:hypothetical protein GQ43DRAFT_287919 [Delitschia confertaspora ATCC 74209]|uniref:Uncharacterized protein n=1 Tax=Delitschia confertaspora ATCC 74209 TaxID=1513339 RepID=A0A9P4JTL2_9PLEO|nr:hypothetical protein GQ43DRAFT_287919 [Delitschia confertaspora ATCC 74209]
MLVVHDAVLPYFSGSNLSVCSCYFPRASISFPPPPPPPPPPIVYLTIVNSTEQHSSIAAPSQFHHSSIPSPLHLHHISIVAVHKRDCADVIATGRYEKMMLIRC